MKDKIESITIQAPAKLNLTLNITGRRADGYHLLDSLFVFCGLHDQITVEADDNLRFMHISGPFADAMGISDDNLVMRAAKLLQTEADTKQGAGISVIKNIPVAAGLGGGSADAAATLNALNQLWKLEWPLSQLEILSAKLGADIPACIQSKPVIARGIGDILSPAPAMPECGVLLVNPRLSTLTPAVFKAYAASNPKISARDFSPLPKVFADLEALIAAIAPRGNDLLEAAISVQPAIKDVLEALKLTPSVQHVGLSGSGATCFALYENVQKATIAGARLEIEYPHWWQWSGR